MTPEEIENAAKKYAKTDCYDDPIVNGRMTNYPYIDQEKKKHFTEGARWAAIEIADLENRLKQLRDTTNDLMKNE